MQQSNLRLVTDAPPSFNAQVSRVPAAAGHTVQFYEDEQFLYGVVGDFLAEGLVAGQPLIVIATEEHRSAFMARLRSRGFDVDYLVRCGRLTAIDARETLASFMVADVPDAARFDRAVGTLVARIRRDHGNASVRAYGEMVDLLWRDGNTAGAIRLEELWNELAARQTFSLLCAYAMGNFYKSADSRQFEEVCFQHSHVVPTETYTQAGDAQRAVQISMLQQRAQALESEIAAREELEQRLRAALAEAEAANRAKSEFLAVMSHELRTPLNAIGGHVQLVEMGLHGPVTDAQRGALARVVRSQQHLLLLINDVLNLARIESGEIEYSIAEFPVVALLADICALLEPLASRNQLTCHLDCSETGPILMARADREKVRQIVSNLLTNAHKFTPPGGLITLRAEPREGQIAIMVTDNGVGIEATKLETIFEPFVQLGHRAGTTREGIGLGLAISRDLARGMGGEVEVTSAVGKGTTFTLLLPAA